MHVDWFRIQLLTLNENVHNLKHWLATHTSFEIQHDDPAMMLQFAAWTGNGQLVQELIKQRQNVATQDSQGWTSLHLAVWNMHWDVIKMLLLDPMINVNAMTDDGLGAVHFAVYNNDVRTLITLLQAGADVSIYDKFGCSPMDLARSYGHVNSIKALEYAITPMAE